MAALSQADTSALVILAIIVFIMIRRTVILAQGALYGPTRIFAYGGFSMFLFAFFAATTIYVAWGTWGTVALALLAPYAAVVIAAALAAEPIVRRRVKFEDRGGGAVYYRLPLIIPVLTLILFVVRVAVEIWMFGLAAFATFAIPTSLSATALAILIAFDLVYGASIGLLIGRGLGVRRAFLDRPQPTGTPLAS